MKQDPNIDELLNGYIDGELTARQHTEVKRLVENDAQIAKRLLELQKCRILVSSLPRAEAPAGMVEEIKNSLERRILLSQQPELARHRAGAWHLFARHALTAAAMITLIAVLASVIYTIIAPSSAPERPVAVSKPPVTKIPIDRPEPMIAATTKKPIGETSRGDSSFNGTLEIKTGNLIAVDAYINSAIEDTGLSEKVIQRSEGQRSVYTLTCSREALNLLLTDLENIWGRFDSAVLSVETARFGEQIMVEAVTAEQVAKVADQDSPKNGIQLAKDFAVFNSIDESSRGKDILKAVDSTKDTLITIPKPRLTSGEKAVKKPASQQEAERKVNLTIVVVGSK